MTMLSEASESSRVPGSRLPFKLGEPRGKARYWSVLGTSDWIDIRS